MPSQKVEGAQFRSFMSILWALSTPIAYIFKTFNFSAVEFRALIEHIRFGAFLAKCGMPKYWQHVLCEYHADAWFSTQGLPEVAASFLGSIPGDPLGDIVLNYISILVHGEVENELRAAGLVISLPVPDDSTLQQFDVDGPVDLCRKSICR